MVSRLGTFFLLVGGVLLVVFFFSDYARTPLYNLFCLGIPLFILGIYFKRKGHQPPPPNERFSLVRKYRQQGKDKGKRKGKEKQN